MSTWLCTAFPSLTWLEKTPEQASSASRKLVRQIIEDLVAQGDEVPEANSMKSYSRKFMVRVPPETHRRLALQAAES